MTNGSRWSQVGILLLFYDLLRNIGITKIPKLTLFIIAIQVGIFTKSLPTYLEKWSTQPLTQVCLSPSLAIDHGEAYRILTAPIFHASDLHLYYNMVSFAWKGIKLEGRHGSLRFLVQICIMVVFTGLTYICLSVIMARHFQDVSYLNQCAVGFSGVLFALKVLANDTDGDFGLFSVPKSMAVWLEVFIIQVLVPNSSMLAHVAGILTGLLITHWIPFLFHTLVKGPFTLVKRCPGSFICGLLLSAFHMEWLKKPWEKKWFWSSGPSLICLSHSKAKLDLKRFLSGPLEHAGSLHFIMCLVSFTLKLQVLERKIGMLKSLALAILSFLGTGLTYVFLQIMISGEDQTCVQGLSGVNFSLKIFTFLSNDWNLPLLSFELAELFILLEERTFLYHISGCLFAIFIYFIYIGILSPSRFPGHGIKLGSSELETKSWGYNHTDRQFKRIVLDTTHEEDSPRSSSSAWYGSSDSSEATDDDNRSQRSATPSPRPRQPPPSQGFPPPPPSLSGGMIFRESQSPLEEYQCDFEL